MHSAQTSTKNMRRGFTLVELMVSVGLFSVVMTVSIGTLLVMVDVNAKAQALYSSTSNLSFALDTISRELRTGYDYYCYEGEGEELPTFVPESTQDCAEGGVFVAFTRERDDERIAYRKNGTVLEQYEDGKWIAITSNRDVVVETLDFVVRDTGTSGVQATIDISIQGRVNNGLDLDTEFAVQTHVVGRQLDI